MSKGSVTSPRHHVPTPYSGIDDVLFRLDFNCVLTTRWVWWHRYSIWGNMLTSILAMRVVAWGIWWMWWRLSRTTTSARLQVVMFFSLLIYIWFGWCTIHIIILAKSSLLAYMYFLINVVQLRFVIGSLVPLLKLMVLRQCLKIEYYYKPHKIGLKLLLTSCLRV